MAALWPFGFELGQIIPEDSLRDFYVLDVSVVYEAAQHYHHRRRGSAESEKTHKALRGSNEKTNFTQDIGDLAVESDLYTRPRSDSNLFSCAESAGLAST